MRQRMRAMEASPRRNRFSNNIRTQKQPCNPWQKCTCLCSRRKNAIAADPLPPLFQCCLKQPQKSHHPNRKAHSHQKSPSACTTLKLGGRGEACHPNRPTLQCWLLITQALSNRYPIGPSAKRANISKTRQKSQFQSSGREINEEWAFTHMEVPLHFWCSQACWKWLSVAPSTYSSVSWSQMVYCRGVPLSGPHPCWIPAWSIWLGWSAKSSFLPSSFDLLTIRTIQILVGSSSVRFLVENAGFMKDIHFVAFCKLLGLPFAEPFDQYTWDLTKFTCFIARKRNFFRNFADVEPITDLDSWCSDESGPLLTISGKTVAFAPLLRTRKTMNYGICHSSWTLYQPHALVWDYSFWGGKEAFRHYWWLGKCRNDWITTSNPKHYILRAGATEPRALRTKKGLHWQMQFPQQLNHLNLTCKLNAYWMHSKSIPNPIPNPIQKSIPKLQKREKTQDILRFIDATL